MFTSALMIFEAKDTWFTSRVKIPRAWGWWRSSSRMWRSRVMPFCTSVTVVIPAFLPFLGAARYTAASSFSNSSE